MAAVEMTTDQDAQARATAAAGLLGELQDDAIERDGVIARDGALVLVTEDLLEVDGAERHESWDRLGRRPLELSVEVGQKALAQIAVGRGRGGDAGEAELIDEAPLQGAVHALTAAAGLRRVAEDVLDAELGQRAADLGQLGAIGGPAGHRGVRGPVGPIGVEGHRQAAGGEHAAQGGQDACGALAALGELGGEDLLGGIVDDGDEREPLLGSQRQPLMPAAVEVEQFAETGAGLAPATVAAPRALLRHQPGALQRRLDEGVAEADAVRMSRLAQEVPDVEAVIVRAVQMQHPLDLGQGGPLGRGRLPAPIQQTVIAVALVAQAQPANTPGTAAEDVGGLEPGELPTQRSQDDLLDLHGALHGADGIGHGHLLGDQFSPDARLERSFHVSLGSGQITYSRQTRRRRLDVGTAIPYTGLTSRATRRAAVMAMY